MGKAFEEKKAEEDGRNKGPRFWTSLGSEKEVEAEIIRGTRDPVHTFPLCYLRGSEI